jgi:hypothetical protein
MINKLLNLLRRQHFAAPLQTQDPERPDLILLRVRVFQFGGGTDFATEGAFHDGLEGGPAAGGEGFGFDQEVVRQIKRGLHMGENMVLRLAVNTSLQSASHLRVCECLNREGPDCFQPADVGRIESRLSPRFRAGQDSGVNIADCLGREPEHLLATPSLNGEIVQTEMK